MSLHIFIFVNFVRENRVLHLNQVTYEITIYNTDSKKFDDFYLVKAYFYFFVLTNSQFIATKYNIGEMFISVLNPDNINFLFKVSILILNSQSDRI